MKFSIHNFYKLQIHLLLSLLYGYFVFSLVDDWSFDYLAVVETIDYFKSTDLSYIQILAFNSFVTYFLTKFLIGQDPYFIASLFYGICAAFRFFVYIIFLPFAWFVPIFISMAVMLDFNTSRYSLATSLFILLYGFRHKNNFGNLGIFRTAFLAVPFFHLHHFSVAFIALFSRTSFGFRTFCISLVPIFVLSLSGIFSRFLSANDGSFPRITLIYFTLSTFLIISTRIRILEIKVIYSVLLLLLAFYLSGIYFNTAYYTRFSFLVFEVLLIMIAMTNWAVRQERAQIIFNKKYVKLFCICCVSFIYQAILIGGNIWRFF